MNSDDVVQWREAAVNDGWQIDPMSQSETTETWARLEREGFLAQVIARPQGLFKHIPNAHYDVHIWGPDKLAIAPKFPYRFQDIVDRMSLCANCGAVGETVRISF